MRILTHLQGFLRLQWAKQRPPLIPSVDECKIIKNFIKKEVYNSNKILKILILGSTPRFRDLAHSFKSEVTCADMNIDMLPAMAALMTNPRAAEKEVWVRANWLQMPLRNNYYDIVLGDWVISNLPLKLQSVFFKKISLLIRSGGHFITRASLYSGDLVPFEKALKLWLSGKWDNSHLMMSAAHLDFNPHTYQSHSARFRVKGAQAISKLMWQEKNKQNKSKLKQAIKVLKEWLPTGMTWIYTPKNVLELIIEKYFQIKKIDYARDHYLAQACPIYFLRKR
ncbi:MAG: methyltransferase domain-containing protein [Patescibacteria group bacterium]|nr:methyltransferase domain-containing protein [Patescibacteria group bacterium]MDD5121022.1 methyltransferase domain-containing protein [Patescibacteria group bacterium]MDD5221617.1 methyltransferase domain-containing protein [Patescibacteria group bacterium]MDD5396059.1 methyltransferase domain-containing protein [Patescibacteria group bacterium]